MDPPRHPAATVTPSLSGPSPLKQYQKMLPSRETYRCRSMRRPGICLPRTYLLNSGNPTTKSPHPPASLSSTPTQSLSHPLTQSLARSKRTPIRPFPRKLLLVATRHVVDAVVAQRPHQTPMSANLLDAAASGAALGARGRRRRRLDGSLWR